MPRPRSIFGSSGLGDPMVFEGETIRLNLPAGTIPAGWREILRRAVIAELLDDANEDATKIENHLVAIYPRGARTGTAPLYTPPAGSTEIRISKPKIANPRADTDYYYRTVFVEPSGAIRRSWTILGEPLEVNVGTGRVNVDVVDVGGRRETPPPPNLKDTVGFWWLLPVGWAAWYVASGGPKKARNRRRNPSGPRFIETTGGALLVGAAGSLIANLLTGGRIRIEGT